ncbi:MAG: glycosyltransferase family 4 protein [Muribaculaceae bacterium]|nr:glycosyltransferase family 4 protein [Muribaculaceae bacterium]
MTDTPGTLIHIITDNRWSGVARYALDICSHYIGEGWNVAAFTRDAKAVDTLFARKGVNLLHAPLWGGFDIASAKALSRYLKKTASGHVVIHAHGFRNAFTALLARKIAGRKDVKVIMTRHKVKKGIDSWIFRRIYRNLDAMIFVSRLAADRFLSAWHGAPLPFSDDKIHVIHNSLNIKADSPRPKTEKGPVCAMFHGPLSPGKGIETLIDALSLLKGSRIRLKIVGSGTPDYVDKIRNRALTRGVMDMIDWRKHSDTPMDIIAECDFGVLPSSAEEAFGLANIEYMACGKPLVCSSSGAQPEYITDGREGFLIPPSNTGALADAMRKLASDSELRKRMGERAFVSFRTNLSWDIFNTRLNAIYCHQ